MEKIFLKFRSAITSLIILALIIFGAQGAHAEEQARPQLSEISANMPEIKSSSDLTPEVSEVNLLSIQPSQTSPAITTQSLGDVMKWVCKTLITSVAISAWVYTVVVSDGVVMVVAREVVRYVTVPAVVCDWFF